MTEVTADVAAPTELGAIPELSSISLTPSASDTPFSATSNDTDADTLTGTSTNVTLIRFGTPAGAVLVPGRERSGIVLAAVPRHRAHRARQQFPVSPDTPQPNTETEGDGDVDMDHDHDADAGRPVRSVREAGLRGEARDGWTKGRCSICST